jgi:ribonuclease Z
MKKIVIIVAAAAVIVAALLGLRPILIQMVIRKGATELGNRFQDSLLTDGRLHVVTVGTGSPAPDPYRVQACTAVIADGVFILFDCGSGSASRVESLGLPVAALDAVFLTHLHSDHIADLPLIADTSWRYGRKRMLEVFGPAGTQAVVAGFNQAYYPNGAFRYEDMKGRRISPLELAFPAGHDVADPDPEGRALVYANENGLRVFAFLVDHAPVKPAFGYRIEYKGRVVVLSGDTRRCENVARNARGADMLIHEAFDKDLENEMLGLAQRMSGDGPEKPMALDMIAGIEHYHSSPKDAAEIAAEAGVKILVLSHIMPPIGPPAFGRLLTNGMFLHGASGLFKGKIAIAEDGMQFDL